MPEEKRPLKVFLSHAHADREAVKSLYNQLTADGVDAWLDKEKLLPGQDWELEIRKAVRAADVVVVCLSCQFSEKGFRQKEVRIALEEASLQPEGTIFIIPARLEVCDNLESLRRWHWVDLFEPDGYEYLMRALRIRAEKIGATLQIKKSWFPSITASRPKRNTINDWQKLSFNQNKKQVSPLSYRKPTELPKLENERKSSSNKTGISNKRNGVIVILIILVGIIYVITINSPYIANFFSSQLAFMSDSNSGSKPEMELISGEWNLSYDWDCNGTSYKDVLLLNSDATLNVVFGKYQGSWTIDDENIMLVYDDEYATYTGVVSGNTMTGTMESTGGSTSGCWSAQKNE